MGKQVKRVELAQILGVTPQTLTNWVNVEGLPFLFDEGTTKGKTYDTEQVIEWLVTRKMANRTEGRSALDEKSELGRLTKERADHLALKNAIMKRDYAPVSVMSAVLSKVCVQIGGVLDTLPLTIKRKVPALQMTDVDMIKKEIVKAQNAAASVDSYLEQAIEEAFKGKTSVSDQGDV